MRSLAIQARYLTRRLEHHLLGNHLLANAKALVYAGQDSSEVWGGFRVARRARPGGLRWGEEVDGCWVECAHDGYQRLPGRPRHFRRWRLGVDGLNMHDRISGDCRHAAARYHLHPAVRVELNADGRGGALQLPGGVVERMAGIRVVRVKTYIIKVQDRER